MLSKQCYNCTTRKIEFCQTSIKCNKSTGRKWSILAVALNSSAINYFHIGLASYIKWTVVLSQLTVTSMQWRSLCSSWFLLASTAPSSCWSRCTPKTLRMVRPLSQQKDWSRVKWICRATSSASSAAKTHRTTLSGSLRRKEIMMRYSEPYLKLHALLYSI